MNKINKYIISLPLILLLFADNVFVFCEYNRQEWYIFDLFHIITLASCFFILYLLYNNLMLQTLFGFLTISMMFIYIYNDFDDISYYLDSAKRLLELSYFILFIRKVYNYIFLFSVIYCYIEFVQTAIIKENRLDLIENIFYIILFLTLKNVLEWQRANRREIIN